MYEIVNKLMDTLAVMQKYLLKKHEEILDKRIEARHKELIECKAIIAKLKEQQNLLQKEIEELEAKRIL